MWTVTKDSLTVHRLAGRDRLGALATSFAAAVREASPDSRPSGEALYRALFGELEPEIQRKGRWLLALDGALFGVPFSALPAGKTGAETQAERRVIEVIPAAALWSNGRDATSPSGAGDGLLAGIGDAIYNDADPRRPPARQRAAAPLQLISYGELSRLVAAGPELEICARSWTGSHFILQGKAASREGLASALARNPSVVHFAAHFVESRGPGKPAAIVLSIDSNGRPEILEPAEIARWRVNARLIALSGCHSSAAAVLPGSGPLGLTRAWIAAGAGSVLASYWDVPDDAGPFFAAFYRELSRSGETPAAALRAAQREMIQAGGWRANPRYWAAWFVMGKE